MATEQITDDELLALHALANTRGGVKLGSSVLLRLLNTVAALRRQLEEQQVVVPAPEHSAAFKREDRYLVLKRTDLEHHATPAQLRELKRICEMVRFGRMNEGKRLNSYVVVADDWPEYEETWARIQARMTGTQIQDIRPLSSGEVVATPLTDVVTVPREEWETMHEFLSEWVLLQWADDPRGDGDPAPHRKRIDELFERLDALRSGEDAK